MVALVFLFALESRSRKESNGDLVFLLFLLLLYFLESFLASKGSVVGFLE